MQIFGFGIPVIISTFFAVLFAIHAVRTGRNLYWLFVLFVFPILGSIVYFVVEYLPGSRMNHGVNRGFSKAASATVGLLDPAREVREAREAFDLSPSAQNRMRLAKALLARGEFHESIEHFDACLKGPFGKDPDFLYAAASAKLQDGRAAEALELAKTLRAGVSDGVAEKATLLLAQCHAATGDRESAKAEFSGAVQRFGSIDAKAQYAIWAAGNGEIEVARKLHEELKQSERHWPPHARALNRGILNQVDKAIANPR